MKYFSRICDDTAVLHCFNESKNPLNPHQLSSLFINMTKEGHTTINIYNEESNRQWGVSFFPFFSDLIFSETWFSKLNLDLTKKLNIDLTKKLNRYFSTD